MTCHKENNLVFWCGGHHSKVGWVVVLWKITAQANLDKNNWLYAPRTQRTSHVRIAVLMAWLIQIKQDMLESLILSLGFTDLLTPSAEMFSICCSCFWLLLPIASVQSSYLLVALRTATFTDTILYEEVIMCFLLLFLSYKTKPGRAPGRVFSRILIYFCNSPVGTPK